MTLIRRPGNFLNGTILNNISAINNDVGSQECFNRYTCYRWRFHGYRNAPVQLLTTVHFFLQQKL